MTFAALEARSQYLSSLGLRIRLTELKGTPQGWSWEWALGTSIVERGETASKHKAAALYLALLTGIA